MMRPLHFLVLATVFITVFSSAIQASAQSDEANRCLEQVPTETRNSATMSAYATTCSAAYEKSRRPELALQSGWAYVQLAYIVKASQISSGNDYIGAAKEWFSIAQRAGLDTTSYVAYLDQLASSTPPQSSANSQTQSIQQPSNSEPAQNQGGQLYNLAGPGLRVPVEEAYPSGPYKPLWQVAETSDRVQLHYVNKLLYYPLTDRADRNIAFQDLQGVPVFVFDVSGGNCAADLPGAPIVLGSAPKHFTLSNFRRIGPPYGPCSDMSGYVFTWKGELSLSSTPNGDVIMDLDLRCYSKTGTWTYQYDVKGYRFPNSFTPLQARQQIAQQQQRKQEQEAAELGSPFIQGLRRKAEAGDPESQKLLGSAYQIGKDVTQSSEKAVYWYMLAAKNGQVRAQNALGHCLYDGNGIARDRVQAAYWFGRAAAQGDKNSQAILGILYALGDGKQENGVEKDYAKSAYWLRKAADQGDADSQLELGLDYKYGRGVPQNNKEALFWLYKATAQGNEEAEKEVDKIKQ